jgi:hypothetical protein
MFTHGSLVDVESEERRGRRDSEGGKAYVVKVESGENRTYDVQYIIGNLLSPNVAVSRIRPTMLQTTARLRRGETGTRPSLLSPSLTPRNLDFTRGAETPQQRSNGPTMTKVLFGTSKRWIRGKLNPALILLTKMNEKEEQGWLRKAEAVAAGRDIRMTANPDKTVLDGINSAFHERGWIILF